MTGAEVKLMVGRGPPYLCELAFRPSRGV